MRLTLHTDYALRTLMYLAVHTERLSSIREIATAYGISENHLMKIIHRLGLGGFIETVRGRGGGLRLARPADQIRIGDVVRYTEEDMALVGCQQPEGAKDNTPCLLADACRLRGALGEALGSFMTVLNGYTLADVVTPHERRCLS
ncbi:Rrf2 family transcriptional regulator [Komagataeibacter sp. FNDCR2]|uniref:RrF2 family transcriptional regulator n=1 Tax=Komagataeibacter sp. FNDCR2 TaxID=2878682 RepID=UPI001E3BE814|nr:Rrf2 family transcriptional regulator [Komagataeibacter sp. FNDCR2]MCE2574306.1 Rrf2 family transcriptional regulator [Komagataeibacter sp. FNDCR2]